MVLSNGNKFQALLWKNCIIQRSDVCGLLKTNCLSIITLLMLILIRMYLPTQSLPDKIYNDALSIDNLELFKNTPPFDPDSEKTLQLHLAYSPDTSTVFQEIVKAAATSLSLEYSGYANSKALESALKRENYLTGVEFDDSLASITKYPDKLSYKLRFPNRLRKLDSDWKTYQFEAESDIGYLREGFLPVQNAISTAFIMQASKDNAPNLPKIVMQRYPAAGYTAVIMLGILHAFVGPILILCFVTMSQFVVKVIMEEKEKQLKEVMKIFGLQSWVQWLAWFVSGLIMMGISIIFVMAILMIEWKEGFAYISYASISVIVCFFLAYAMANISMLFLGTTFFSKSTAAVVVMVIILIITLVPYIFVVYTEHMCLGWKLLLCLLPNVAFGVGMHKIFSKELTEEGLHWSNIFKRPSAGDSLSLGLIILMMLLSCVLYMGLCLYVEQIFPSEFGVPQKWNFPFKKSFWVGKHEYEDVRPKIKRDNPDAFEEEPLNAKIGVQVINLSKKYGDADHLAVDNVSLNMYEREITVLLGHNGAGKTTMISMLIGMITTTSGTAIINGYDIRKDLAAARTSLSICPQHNILFDDLTVKQHLIFYGRLKGLRGIALQTEMKKYIRNTNMSDKTNVKSSKLSGGMKRKLSVAAAFCGGTKIVLLDEPSSGLDPAARRQLWDLIISEKEGRTILLTTHFMDEAEVLGDRIAILSGGQLQCSGTPFFLKKKFGSGYNLICIKKKNCDTTEVTKLLNKYIPGIQPTTDIGTELSYRLPDSYTPKFKMMFQDLESNSNRLNLEGYGVSVASIEDVFMKVGGFQGKQDSINLKNVFADNQDRLKGNALLCHHWRAMILKKYLYRIRHKLLFASQILLPILFGSMLWSLLNTGNFDRESKPLLLDLLQYPKTVTVLETTLNVKDESLEAKISNNFKKIIKSLGADHELLETNNQNFIDYMLRLGKTTQPQQFIDALYIASATVDEGKITAWQNNAHLHSAPITLSLIHNAMAKSVIGPSASIDVTNHPAPPLPIQLTEESQKESEESEEPEDSPYEYVAGVVFLCTISVSPLYSLFLIKERQSRAKLLQLVGGISATTFWASHFVYDFFTYAFTILILLIVIALNNVEGYATFEELGRHGVILLLSNCATLPLVYICAEISNSPAAGYIIALSILLFPTIIFQSIKMKNTESNTDYLLLCPPYNVYQASTQMKINMDYRKLCQLLSEELNIECETTTYFAWKIPGVLRNVLYFVLSSILFFFVLFLKESHLMSIMWNWIKHREPPIPPYDAYFDEDVENEKEIVNHLSPLEIAKERLVLDKLTKFYGNFLAVNDISLIVANSECFGLLGLNGAGKTSTFKMLTGDENISSGEAYVNGISLKQDMKNIYPEIGYCPQFDALLDELTGRETLKMYCLIRGIPEEDISHISTDLAIGLGFMKYFNRQVRSYSGGNKRKLSVAIAIIGNPSLIYLDEPTTGMDPAARRHLWNVVCKFRDSGKSIILTSHSMDECEALCTRLAIMVNGEFKCLGSIQHLKTRFTKGLTLKIKVFQEDNVKRKSMQQKTSKKVIQAAMDNMKADIQRIKEFIKSEFPRSTLKEEMQGLLSFHIPLIEITWSKMFALMEDNKDALNIEDYSITQTTLEDVFLQFSKLQRVNLLQ